MVNLKHLSNLELHQSTIKSAKNARAATTELLHHLCELQRRRAFAEFTSDSLFTYCKKHLGMDNPDAARHVNAARVMFDFPEVEEKIQSSSMSLTSVSQAQVFFKKEARAKNPLNKEKKREILEQIDNKSVREVDLILRSHSSQPEKDFVERVRLLSDSLTEVTCGFDNETIEDLDCLKAIWSHSMPGANYSQIIKKMAHICRNHLDPLRKAKRAVERKAKADERRRAMERKAKAKEMRRAKFSNGTPNTSPKDSAGMNAGQPPLHANDAFKDEPRSEAVLGKSEKSKPTLVTPSESLVSKANSPNSWQDHNMKTSPAEDLSNVIQDGGKPSSPTQDSADPYGDEAKNGGPTPNHAPPQATRESFQLRKREVTSNRSRSIHSTIRHAVWMRDGGCCTYIDPRTGERCESRHFLEYDHAIPFAMGGENTVENLRLRCRSHNAWQAIQTYGVEVLKYVRF